MAGFKLEKIENSGGNFDIIEYFPSTANETYTLGEVLTMTSDAMTAAGDDSDGTQKFICQEAYVAPASGNRKIAVSRILPTKIYRVLSYADNSSTAIGTLVTLHTDEAQVTATSTKGVFEITDKLGSGAAGTEVLGRFPTAAGR